MTDAARRTYLALGRGFVVVGVAIAVLAIADLVANLGFFRGGPLGTAVFLTLVGGALLWTVRQADAQRGGQFALHPLPKALLAQLLRLGGGSARSRPPGPARRSGAATRRGP